MFTEEEEMKVELAERLRTSPSATFSHSGTQGHNGAQQGLLYRHQSGHGNWQSDTERGLVFHPDAANCLKDLRQIFNLVK